MFSGESGFVFPVLTVRVIEKDLKTFLRKKSERIKKELLLVSPQEKTGLVTKPWLVSHPFLFHGRANGPGCDTFYGILKLAGGIPNSCLGKEHSLRK